MRSGQIKQGFIQHNPENLQGWELHNVLQKPNPLLGCLLEEKLSLQEFELLLVQLMLIICHPTTTYHSEAAGSVFLVTSQV